MTASIVSGKVLDLLEHNKCLYNPVSDVSVDLTITMNSTKHNIDISTTGNSKSIVKPYLLVIDNRVEYYQQIINTIKDDVCYIVINYETDDFQTLLSKISLFGETSFRTIGWLSHGYFAENVKLLGSEEHASCVKDVQNRDPTIASWNPLKDFVTTMQTKYNIDNMDFISCNLASYNDYRYIFSQLEEQCGINIRASNEKVGSSKMGGKWSLENGKYDLKQHVFGEDVENVNVVLPIYYNIDFGSLSSTSSSVGGEAGQPGTWNDISASGTGTIVDINGQNSINYSLVCQNMGSWGASSDNILRDNFYSNTETWSFTLTGLNSGTANVYYYAPANGSVDTGDFTINTTTSVSSLGTGYGIATGVAISTNTMVFTNTNNSSYRGLAGLQIIAPDPPPPPPMALVTGKVPNWLQPKSGQYSATMGGYESQFPAWCSPTSAANQLGHLVDHGGVTQPTNINDGTVAGNDTPIALAASTIAWDSGYGWGDYMLDGPTYRGKNLFNGTVTDFGWYMNTNNLGPLGAGAASPVGSTLQNIYNGMVDFYQQVGYTNMVGMVYHFNGSIQNFGVDPAYWTANGHNAGAGVSADYTITLNTIKHEIDNNRTVMACFNGWNITPAGHPDLTGMTSNEDETGIYQTLGEYQSVGPHGEQFNIASTEGGNIESYNAGLGHTVLIVGYIPAGSAQDPTGNTEWLVVRDNFTTTHKNVIIPFANLSKLLATVYVNHTTATYNAITVGGTDYGSTTTTTSALRRYPPDYSNSTNHALTTLQDQTQYGNDWNYSGHTQQQIVVSGESYGNGTYFCTGQQHHGQRANIIHPFVDGLNTDYPNGSGNKNWWPRIDAGGAPGNQNVSIYPYPNSAEGSSPVNNDDEISFCHMKMPVSIILQKVTLYYNGQDNVELYIFGTNSDTTTDSSQLNIVFRSYTGDSTRICRTLSSTDYTYEATGANSATEDYLANNSTPYKNFWLFVRKDPSDPNKMRGIKELGLFGIEQVSIDNTTSLSFDTNTLTIENSITNTDTDKVSFTLPANNEMASLNVTNFSGTGTVTYTLATGGSTVTSGTFTATGTNLLAGNALSVTADTTYVLTLTADAEIIYTIVGTKVADYGTTVTTTNWSVTPDSHEVLTQSDLIAGDYFGQHQVAVDGNYAIVGAFYEDSAVGTDGTDNSESNIGAAYIFELINGSWNNITVLKASDGDATDYFGNSVAISGNYAIVGARNAGSTLGEAYIYERVNGVWGNAVSNSTQRSETIKILGSDRIAYGRYGQSVAINGDYAIVGAWMQGANSTYVGAAYIYERANGVWGEEVSGQTYRKETKKITQSNPVTNDYFGYSVAISGTYAIVGAFGSHTTHEGSAYIFERDASTGWPSTETININASVRTIRDVFGGSVAIDGNYAIVGARQATWGGDAVGAVYIYERVNGVWGEEVSGQTYRKETVQFKPSDGSSGDNFGWSVAINGNNAIVGAYKKTENSISQLGAAYTFVRDGNGVWGAEVSGQTYRNENVKISPPNNTASLQFGHSIAINNGYALIGSSGLTMEAYMYKAVGGTVAVPTTLSFSNNTLTIENSINTTDTDAIDFVLPAGEEMASMNVTNFVGTGTVSYTISTTGADNITGTFTSTGTNLLIGNPLIASADTTYVLTLTADAAITYTIVSTKVANYGSQLTTTSALRQYPPDYVDSTSHVITTTQTQGSKNNRDYDYTMGHQRKLVVSGQSYGNGDYYFTGVHTNTHQNRTTHERVFMSNINSQNWYVDARSNGNSPGTKNLTIYPNPYSGEGSSPQGDDKISWFQIKMPVNIILKKVQLYYTDQSQAELYIFGTNSETTTDSSELNPVFRSYVGGTRPAETAKETSYTWEATGANSATQDYLANNSTPYKNYWAFCRSKNNSLPIYAIRDLYLFGIEEVVINNSISLSFDTNTLTIENSINTTDTDIVDFVLPAGEEMTSMNVTNFVGTGTVTYTISTTGADNITGTFTSTGTNLLIGNPLIASADTTYVLTLTANAAITYTIVGIKTTDYEHTGNITSLTFSNNILTIENSINSTDTDMVDFVLPVNDEMHQLVVTNFVGTGTINYTITTGATTVKTGTFTSTGTNLLLDTPLSPGGSTYQVSLTANASITYTIIGTKAADLATTTLTFSNNVLTIDNVTSTTDTDIINFVLPAGYNIPELNVTNFNGTGNVSYTLSTGGNTIISGTFSAISSNLLQSGFPIFALSTDVTYVLTITADALIGYSIVGTKTITNLSNYSIVHFLSSGFTEQQLIDAGIWDADPNANRFNSTYNDGFLDISGNITVTDKILMDNGNVDLHNHTFSVPYAFSSDPYINNRLFVDGNVSMGDSSLNIVGDISINGVMTVGSYKPASISTAAIAVDNNPGYSTANSTTTFTEDIVYDNKIQFNGDISLNVQVDNGVFINNPNSTTYFGTNTTLKANTGIEFPDNTTLHSSNKETNGTTFKASTFNNMTVVGDFASNPQLTPSDYRIKNNVETLDETHIIDNLRPVKYKQTQTGKNDIGFLAHELQEHYPELVEGEKDGDKMQSVNYSGLLPILINEVQQLKKQIAETRARIHSETS